MCIIHKYNMKHHYYQRSCGETWYVQDSVWQLVRGGAQKEKIHIQYFQVYLLFSNFMSKHLINPRMYQFYIPLRSGGGVRVTSAGTQQLCQVLNIWGSKIRQPPLNTLRPTVFYRRKNRLKMPLKIWKNIDFWQQNHHI